VSHRQLKTKKLELKNLPVLNFEFDREARAVYITIATGEVYKTKRISDSLFIDVDKNGKTLGIEILRVKSINITPLIKELAETYPIKDLLHLQKAV